MPCIRVQAGGRAGLAGATQALDVLTALMVHVADGKMTGENKSMRNRRPCLFNQCDCRSLPSPQETRGPALSHWAITLDHLKGNPPGHPMRQTTPFPFSDMESQRVRVHPSPLVTRSTQPASHPHPGGGSGPSSLSLTTGGANEQPPPTTREETTGCLQCSLPNYEKGLQWRGHNLPVLYPVFS